MIELFSGVCLLPLILQHLFLDAGRCEFNIAIHFAEWQRTTKPWQVNDCLQSLENLSQESVFSTSHDDGDGLMLLKYDVAT